MLKINKDILLIVTIALFFFSFGMITLNLISDFNGRDYNVELEVLEYNKIQLELDNILLQDSLTYTKNKATIIDLENARLKVVVQGLKNTRNEKITSIDTMDSKQLYLFFSER